MSGKSGTNKGGKKAMKATTSTVREDNIFDGLDFADLKDRFGFDNARTILRTLEKFEGISDIRVSNLSEEDRMRNVMTAMKDNIRYQTRH
ncbi:MAG: hypothetical protein KGI97_02415 [Alphaproteobacteria bacterium]|nr:hypothetical protein [Alphaproteobacteria bacterium]